MHDVRQCEFLLPLLATGHCNTLLPLERIHNRPTNGGTTGMDHRLGYRTRGKIGSRDATHKRAAAIQQAHNAIPRLTESTPGGSKASL